MKGDDQSYDLVTSWLHIYLLQSFKTHFVEFREHTRLFKFIPHPHVCKVDKADLSNIPFVSIRLRDVEIKVAELKAYYM